MGIKPNLGKQMSESECVEMRTRLGGVVTVIVACASETDAIEEAVDTIS